MVLLSNEDQAWTQFLTASENSIIRDAGEVLAALTGNSFGEEKEMVSLKQKSPKDWEQALLVAECLKLSENDNLIELSRIIYEWFAWAFSVEVGS